MQTTWNNFLKENTHQNTIDEKSAPIISPLTDFAVLTVSGNDRHVFLHSQFINDLNLIKDPAAQLSAWCNPKGQVITNFIIINTGISYLLIFKQDLKDYVQKRLTMFVLRSDVKIEDISESSPLIGISNVSDISALTDKTPENAGEVIATDGLIIVSHPDNSGRYLVTGTIEALTTKLPELKIELSPSTAWDLLDIQAGLPWITKTTQEQFLPQMLNLDGLHGLSYQKGCYPGQEVIARLHYRGEVKKRVQIIKSKSELSIGTDIISEEKKVGTAINSINMSESLNYGLAIVDLDALENELFIENNKVDIIDLPYQIDS